MKDLNNLDIFVRVVLDGSFSATARQLGITPSSISRQISQLEEELGARLFSRTTRKQTLTEAGSIFFQRAQQIVNELNDAKLAVNRLSDSPSGLLNISAEADLSQNFIAPVLPEFLARYPNINVQIVMSSHLLDLVDNSIDLAIRMGHLPDSNLVVRKLAVSQSVICASPEYLSANGTPQMPSDLSQHNCLSFRTSPGIKQWRFKTEQGVVDIPISGRVNVNSILFLRELSLAGMGIVMMPKWSIRKELAEGKLVPILERFPMEPDHTPIHAVFNHSRHLPPKVRAFIDFMIEKLGDKSAGYK